MNATDIVAYTFDADIFCVDCTERAYPGVTDWRREGFDPADYTDSEGNEIAPVFASVNESDMPEHCGRCRTFLENDLTADGYAYVLETLKSASGSVDVLGAWWDHYSGDFDDSDWQEIATAWWPRMLAHMPLGRAVAVSRGSTVAPNGSDGSVGHRYATVSFAFDRPTLADDAYRPFRKDAK